MTIRSEKAVIAPWCPSCETRARLTNGAEVWPHRRDLADRKIWKCDGCGTYVGCHPGTIDALGTLAGPELRKARGHVHSLLDPIWQTVDKMLRIERSGIEIVLCHYAMRVWAGSGKGSLQFYGHSHGNLPGDNRSTDVGVDCWEFQPVCIEEIVQRLARQPYRIEPDHHGGGAR